MKSFSVCLSLLAIVIGTGIVHADCGKAHDKSDPHSMGKIASTGFQDMDTDKSGKVSFEEFKAVFPRTSQSGFNILDKDVDNQLNEAEWNAFKAAHKGMGNYKPVPETTCEPQGVKTIKVRHL